ncbi:acyl carrier protein [Asticcacaulis sp.]|uniref:acyl carrier protein n=1 Tax=Asticcacaulis sp. TaxID=1872648 RepID=UPI00260A998A|nr:acyl carrier protein [Asticcacaulis sp.]
MTDQTFIASVAEILEIDPAGLTGAETLTELGNWDSLAVITFVAMADANYNTVVSGDQLRAAQTINDLAALVGL